MATDKKREIVRAARSLFRRQGYAGTGLSEILAESNAPKGSLYHYFPEGKEAIGAAAIAESGEATERELKAYAAAGLASDQMVLRAARDLGAWMEQSGFSEGCSIATTVLETAPAIERIRAAGERAFASWRAVFEAALLAENVAPERARKLAVFALSALQGGLVQSRAALSIQPLLDSAEEAAQVLRAARGAAKAA